MRVFTLILLLLAGSQVSAAVYKWVDEKGQVHYSSRPQNENAEEIKIRDQRLNSTPGASPETAQQRLEKQRKYLEAERQDKESIRAEKLKQQAEEQKRERQCHQARDHLANIERAGTLYDLDEKGKRVYLSEEQKKKSIENVRNYIAKQCQ